MHPTEGNWGRHGVKIRALKNVEVFSDSRQVMYFSSLKKKKKKIEIEHVYRIYGRHAKASKAAINQEKTQIFRLRERNVPTKLEHDDFTKKVKDKVTILRAVFCKDSGQETSENLQKAIKTLEKFQDGYSKFVSLAGKILKLNTYVFSTVWNNAWLIEIKDPHFKAFIRKMERFLCKYKGNEILEKNICKQRQRGPIDLINIKVRIQAIQAFEYLNADLQTSETNNVFFEVGLHQKTIYQKIVAKRGNASQTKEIITLIVRNISEIKKYMKTHKIVKPKNKINYFLEIYIPLEPKLVSINYLVLHNLLPKGLRRM